MTSRTPIVLRVGDRTIVGGRLAEIVQVFPDNHKLAGGVRVRFVDEPRERVVVRAAALEWIGFGETDRGVG